MCKSVPICEICLTIGANAETFCFAFNISKFLLQWLELRVAIFNLQNRETPGNTYHEYTICSCHNPPWTLLTSTVHTLFLPTYRVAHNAWNQCSNVKNLKRTYFSFLDAASTACVRRRSDDIVKKARTKKFFRHMCLHLVHFSCVIWIADTGYCRIQQVYATSPL